MFNYVSDESSLYTASSDAGDDSDSSYCPASYRRRSQTVISKGPVLGSIVIHPLVLQSVEPHTGTQWPVCNESPESVKPVVPFDLTGSRGCHNQAQILWLYSFRYRGIQIARFDWSKRGVYFQ